MSQSLKVQENTIFSELNLVVAGYTAPQGQPQSECCTQGDLQMSKVIASKYFSEKHCSVALVPAVGTDQCCGLGLALFLNCLFCSVLVYCQNL